MQIVVGAMVLYGLRHPHLIQPAVDVYFEWAAKGCPPIQPVKGAENGDEKAARRGIHERRRAG